MSGMKRRKIYSILITVPLILFALGYVMTLGASVEKTVAQDATIPHLTLDNVTFHSETFGDPQNPVVIVVHGGPGSGDYRSMLSLQELGDEFFVVFYDQRGTGLSPRVDASQLTFDRTVSDLNMIVDHYGRGTKVSLIGHSFGGMVVSPYLGKYPEKVAKAVISDPGFLTTETAIKYMTYFAQKAANKPPQSVIDKVKVWFELLHIQEIDGQESQDYLFMRNSFAKKPIQPEFYCNGEYATSENRYWRYGALASSSIQDMAGQTSEFASMTAQGPEINFDKDVERYTGKVLFIASGCNKVIGEEVQKIHIKSFSNAELKVIEDAGHDMYAGKPAAVLKIIREYFSEVS